ncbi:zinc finger protein 480-like isoform X2 [Uranotaenia lowii]|nr:zinc finger protein 480-like isoform X2 [Uranotaenia lowii]
MVESIIGYQKFCEEMNALLSKKEPFPNEEWKLARSLVISLCTIVENCHLAVKDDSNNYDEESPILQKIHEDSALNISETSHEFLAEESGLEIKKEPECENFLLEEECSEQLQHVKKEIKPVTDSEVEESNDFEPEDHSDYENEELEEVSDNDSQKIKTRKKRNKPNEARTRCSKVACETCGEMIAGHLMEGHVNRHMGLKPFVCEHESCGRFFTSKYSLQQHRHQHKARLRYYDCQVCGKRIKGDRSWANHRKLHTEEPKSRTRCSKVVCETCGEMVAGYLMEGHMNRHMGLKPFVCEHESCGRFFTSKYSLQQHRHQHKARLRYYDCQVCGKRIKGDRSWLKHRKLHTEEPKYECNVCGKKFRRGDHLKLHSVVHTGMAMFSCDLCSKRFNVKHNLGTHMKNVHKMKGPSYAAAMNLKTSLQQSTELEQPIAHHEDEEHF